MNRFKVLPAACAALFLAAGAVFAGPAHGPMAEGVGVLNSVDAESPKVNISHKPMPAIGWGKMTMDFPVLDTVDLTGFKEGQKVQFLMEKRADHTFPIHAMCATDKDEVVEGLCGQHDDYGAHDHDR